MRQQSKLNRDQISLDMTSEQKIETFQLILVVSCCISIVYLGSGVYLMAKVLLSVMLILYCFPLNT